MSELDEYIISGIELAKHAVPFPFVYKALYAPSVNSVVPDGHIFIEKLRKHLTPPPFRIAIRIGFVSHGGISDQVKGDGFLGLFSTGGDHKEADQEKR